MMIIAIEMIYQVQLEWLQPSSWFIKSNPLTTASSFRATQSSGLPITYIFYNAFFLLSLFWALAHKDLEEPVFFAATINVAAILFDAIIIGIWYSHILNGFSIL